MAQESSASRYEDWLRRHGTGIDVFKSWVGDYTAPSKVAVRAMVRTADYKTILDCGAGLCSEADGYKADGYDIAYKAIDGSRRFVGMARERGVDCDFGSVEELPYMNSAFEVVHMRHVLEHLTGFKTALGEAIRVSSREVFVVFFLNPIESPTTDTVGDKDLSHNRYDKRDIEAYLNENTKVQHFTWSAVAPGETLLRILMKDANTEIEVITPVTVAASIPGAIAVDTTEPPRPAEVQPPSGAPSPTDENWLRDNVIFYTAAFGRQAQLHDFDRRGFRFICFSDIPRASNTWQVHVHPRHENPRLDAKWYKTCPDAVLPRDGYEVSIWIDASVTPTDVVRMASVCTRALRKSEQPIALFLHPERDNIYDEVAASASMGKYNDQPMHDQVEAYRRDGLPDDHGLWAAGIIARVPRATALLGQKWFHENRHWTIQDQLSLPYVFWKLGMKPGVIPGNFYGTEFHKRAWLGPTDETSDAENTVVIVDNFLRDPGAMRALALDQQYSKMGSAGVRSHDRFDDLIDPYSIEQALGLKIPDWKKYDLNGRFQFCTSEDPVVFHSDTQTHAGVLFLNPDAPVEAGLSLWKSRATGMRRAPTDTETERRMYAGKLLDPTAWDLVDRIGNVYNRLVLFDAHLIHSSTCYFGTDKLNSRLFQMFFFDVS